MTVTVLEIRNAKARETPYKLTDDKGLYLLVNKSGKYWRFDYRFEGKRKTFALGTYPEVPLAGHKDKHTGEWINGARDKRDQARQQLANGTDPAVTRAAIKAARADRAANSFEIVAREWHANLSTKWESSHSRKILSRLERDLFPWIGGRPISELTAPEILVHLRRIEERGAIETAHRALQYTNRVYRFAIATGKATINPASALGRDALKPITTKHFGAITEPKELAALLRAIDGYQGSFVTKCALQVAPLVFVRPGELRKAEWSEINLDSAQWVIPANKMKIKDADDHIVPLAQQTLAILRELQPLTGHGRFVFPGAHNASRPMSENAVSAGLKRMGYTGTEMTGHGFRATARTILDEVLQFRPDFIEHQLAHAVRDPNGRAYNRTAHLAERRRMMQAWADYLNDLKNGAEVVVLRGRVA